MKKNLTLFSFCFLVFLFQGVSCQPETKTEQKQIGKTESVRPKSKEKIDWKKLNITVQPLQKSYTKICKNIELKKQTTDSLSFFFEEVLVNQIFPFWYGTAWDFNGHTNVPNKGEIACGYFVSTTLKHMGFNLNRFRLAQQLPIHEAKTLCLGDSLIEINEKNFEECLKKMDSTLSSGLHFIGLAANHVGFLLKRKGQLFFIHSSYGTPSEVVIEKASESSVLKSFSHFYLVNLSKNKKLMAAWKQKKLISVITK